MFALGFESVLVVVVVQSYYVTTTLFLFPCVGKRTSERRNPVLGRPSKIKEIQGSFFGKEGRWGGHVVERQRNHTSCSGERFYKSWLKKLCVMEKNYWNTVLCRDCELCGQDLLFLIVYYTLQSCRPYPTSIWKFYLVKKKVQGI